MQFYNLKTRSHVEVPEADVHKVQIKSKTKNGEQTRYAFTATHEGQKLFKFVSEKAYTESSAKEQKTEAKSSEAKGDAKSDTKADAKKSDDKKAEPKAKKADKK